MDEKMAQPEDYWEDEDMVPAEVDNELPEEHEHRKKCFSSQRPTIICDTKANYSLPSRKRAFNGFEPPDSCSTKFTTQLNKAYKNNDDIEDAKKNSENLVIDTQGLCARRDRVESNVVETQCDNVPKKLDISQIIGRVEKLQEYESICNGQKHNKNLRNIDSTLSQAVQENSANEPPSKAPQVPSLFDLTFRTFIDQYLATCKSSEEEPTNSEIDSGQAHDAAEQPPVFSQDEEDHQNYAKVLFSYARWIIEVVDSHGPAMLEQVKDKCREVLSKCMSQLYDRWLKNAGLGGNKDVFTKGGELDVAAEERSLPQSREPVNQASTNDERGCMLRGDMNIHDAKDAESSVVSPQESIESVNPVPPSETMAPHDQSETEEKHSILKTMERIISHTFSNDVCGHWTTDDADVDKTHSKSTTGDGDADFDETFRTIGLLSNDEQNTESSVLFQKESSEAKGAENDSVSLQSSSTFATSSGPGTTTDANIDETVPSDEKYTLTGGLCDFSSFDEFYIRNWLEFPIYLPPPVQRHSLHWHSTCFQNNKFRDVKNDAGDKEQKFLNEDKGSHNSLSDITEDMNSNCCICLDKVTKITPLESFVKTNDEIQKSEKLEESFSTLKSDGLFSLFKTLFRRQNEAEDTMSQCESFSKHLQSRIQESDFERIPVFDLHWQRKYEGHIIQATECSNSSITIATAYTYHKTKKGVKRAKISTQESHISEDNFLEGTLQHQFLYHEPAFFIDNYAKISDVASDPPGQQSVYIPPGDVRKEAYRLSTFDNFPRNITVSIVQLAKQGFLYTGYLDRVKCYSCGRTVEKWEPSDAAEEQRYHKPDCLMVRGGAPDNIPIGGFFNKRMQQSHAHDAAVFSRMNQNASTSSNTVDRLPAGGIAQIRPGGSVHVNANGVSTLNGPLRNAASSGTPRQWRLANIISSDHRRYLTNLHLNREIDRLATFSRWPITRPNVAPVDVAKAGFFYLGDMDRTQCFSCGGVLRNWTRDDNAMDEHRTHFGSCRFVLGTDNRNVPVPIVPETQAQMTANYPCQHPTNPHMRSEQTRLATFDSRWPSVRTRATPEQIAEAGFFYLGERDRVKCWYCNGGLQNWEYDDIPWVEHAKWFPSCQFLLRNKGQHFVYRHLSVSPHLPRPVIGRQAGSIIDPVQPGQQRGQDIPPPISRARAPTPPPTIIDPQEEMRRRKEEVDKEIRENTGVRIVIDMGFDEEVVRKVLEERLEYLMSAEDQMDHIRTKIFDNTEQLLNAVQGREAEIRRELEEEREATRLKEIQQSQEPMSVAYPSVSSNYSTFEMSTMETAPSMASQASGVNNVSGFPIDSDEEGDIYGSMPQGATAAVASATVPTSMSEIQSYGLDIPEDPASLKDMIERKKEEGQCKICFTEAANMVFMPCSHMCCCKNCTEAIKYCPVCRKKINRAIIVYLE